MGNGHLLSDFARSSTCFEWLASGSRRLGVTAGGRPTSLRTDLRDPPTGSWLPRRCNQALGADRQRALRGASRGLVDEAGSAEPLFGVPRELAVRLSMRKHDTEGGLEMTQNIDDVLLTFECSLDGRGVITNFQLAVHTSCRKSVGSWGPETGIRGNGGTVEMGRGNEK